MLNKEIENYYEIDRYCRWEGLNTQYFIQQVNYRKEYEIKRLLVSAITALKGNFSEMDRIRV